MPSITKTVQLIETRPASRTAVIKLQDNVALTLGSGTAAPTPTSAASDVSLLWNGTNLVLTPTTDDTGAFNIGDGTTDMDFKVFLGTTSDYILADVGNKRLDMQGATTLRVAREAKLLEADYDPASRVYWRSSFDGRAYSAAVISDWSLFNSVASANPDWVFSMSATNGQTRASSDGAMVLSGSGSSALVFLKPRTGSRLNKIKWNTSRSPRFRVVMKTGASVADSRFMIGLESAALPKYLRNSAPDSNRVEVYFHQNADSRLHGRKGAGASSSSATLAGVLAADTVYDIDIRVDSSRIATVYVNGTLVWTATTALAASKSLIPIIAHQSEGAKRAMCLYYAELSQDFG